ncbi:MAG TPA: hypothetical protein VKV37_06735 [Ktedonobacteraceae bacterium]|jgi:hypothetical protein|nr:hypothetical protein [Ktedonobacteraceae bacterium]
MSTITNLGAAIWSSISSALNLAFSFVPKLVGFLLVLLIGWIVASLLAKAVTFLLKRIGFERMAERIGLNRLEQRLGMRMDAATLLGKIVFWFVFLIFLIPAFNSLGLPTVSNILQVIISYIPNVFVAVLVLFLGTLLAAFVADIVRGALSGGRLGNASIIANIARGAIIGFAALMALYQLQIAPAIIETLFTAVVGALALAFGLAFGLGGRESAQRWLQRGESAMEGTTSGINAMEGNTPGINAQQSINQARSAAQAQAEQMRASSLRNP